MPGQWLTGSVVSRSFSWARWDLWGPVPTVTVLKGGSSLEPAGNHLWLTFQDSSLSRLSIGRPSDTLQCPLFWPHSLIRLLSKTPSIHASFTTDIIFKLHWLCTSSQQRRRTPMRMLTWSGRVWVGSLVCWRATDLGPPWTGSWTLHLRWVANFLGLTSLFFPVVNITRTVCFPVLT